MELKLMFHVHTKYSFDSSLDPGRVVQCAIKSGYDIISVTDHGTVAGSLAVKEIIEKRNLPLLAIIGAEYRTDRGDIIGLFLNVEDDCLRSPGRNFKDVINWVKEMDGITVLPHPFREEEADRDVVELVDLIEVYNGRSSPHDNERAAFLAEECSKPILAGSDAHSLVELYGTAVIFHSDANEIQDRKKLKRIILNDRRHIYYCPRGRMHRVLNAMIQSYQLRDVAPMVELGLLGSSLLKKTLSRLTKR